MSKSIGQIIKELRKDRNLTQEELAELLNVSGQSVSKWENALCMPDVSQIVPMVAHINHAEHNYTDESMSRQYDFIYLLEAILDTMTGNGCTYLMRGKYEDALTVFPSAFALIEQVFKDEKYLPMAHVRLR